MSFGPEERSATVTRQSYGGSLRRREKGLCQQYWLSPSGYGLHWPEVDEDLSVDGLIGTRHSRPMLAVHA